MNFKIGRHMVGYSYPTYFIADIASNHDGLLSRARDLIYAAAASGAQAVKFQNFRADTIVSDYGFKELGKQSHQEKWGKSVYDTYKENEVPLEWSYFIKGYCDQVGVDYITSPYDINDIWFLSNFVCAWKVGSGDITYHQIIKEMLKYNKPMIIATGASTIKDIFPIEDMIEADGRGDVVFLQCNTNYTGSEENFKYINLSCVRPGTMAGPDFLTGLSDHTPGHTTVLGAVMWGARVIEKHFTDDNSRDGPDHAFSMSPQSFMDMVLETRRLEAAMGDWSKKVEPNERETVVLQRRAIRTTRNISAGETLAQSDVICLRPAPPDSLPPYKMEEVVGRVCKRDVPEGDYLREEDCGLGT